MSYSSDMHVSKLMEVTNRFTPPANLEGYLREQGYCSPDLHQIMKEIKEEEHNNATQKTPDSATEVVKFIVTVPARENPGEDFIAKCLTYSKVKSSVIRHLANSNQEERLVVPGTIEDIRAIIAEIQHIKNQSGPRFPFTWPQIQIN